LTAVKSVGKVRASKIVQYRNKLIDERNKDSESEDFGDGEKFVPISDISQLLDIKGESHD
jgi:hypothetical protein